MDPEKLREALDKARDEAEERAVRLEDEWGVEHHTTAEAYGHVQGLEQAIALVSER